MEGQDTDYDAGVKRLTKLARKGYSFSSPRPKLQQMFARARMVRKRPRDVDADETRTRTRHQ